MKRYLIMFGLILTLFLLMGQSGCETQPQIKPKPSISEVNILPGNKVTPGEEFNLFFRIANPTSTYFTPYIGLGYETEEVSPKDYSIRENKGNKISLTSIQRNSAKDYYIPFEVKSGAKGRAYEISVALYEKEDSLAPIGEIKQIFVYVGEKVSS